jgi:hypothetical protein
MRGASADSIRSLYQSLTDDARAHPERYYITEAGMIAVGTTLALRAGTRGAGLAVLRLSIERSPNSARSRDALLAATTGEAGHRVPQ